MKISLISVENTTAANGLRIISSNLKKYGYDTRLIFLPSVDKLYSQHVIEGVIGLVSDSEIVGISSMSYSSDRAEQLINSLKPLKKTIILGGIHATLNPFECLKFADFVCVGEGEEVMLEITQMLERDKDISKTKNLYIKKDYRILTNPLRKLTNNLDTLPFPDYDFNEKYILDKDRIIPLTEHHFCYGDFNAVKPFLKKYHRFMLVHTSRGCPHSCSFCHNLSLKKIYQDQDLFVRLRNIKNVIAELAFLKRKIHSLKYLWFTDDSFFLRCNKKIEMFSHLYKEKIRLPFMCYGDPITITDDKLQSFVNSGLNCILIGVQTGSESINKKIYSRNTDNKQILRLSHLLNKYKDRLIPEYQIINTSPYDKEEDLIKTINLLLQIPKPYLLGRFNLVFFPGSLLYFKAKKDGFLKEKKDSCYNMDYRNLSDHLRIKKINKPYLYYVIHLMGKNVTKLRYGIIPSFLLRFLINKKVIRFCNNSTFIIYGLLPTIMRYST